MLDPFDPAEIKWRVTTTSSQQSKNGTVKRGQLVAYADQRAYTDRLNEIFGEWGWTRQSRPDPIAMLRGHHGKANHIDRIDPRILRGGRFSEKVEIPVPDQAGYQKLVARYVGKARLGAGLTVHSLAERVAGMSPADLEATIHSMKRVAMRRMAANSKELPPLDPADLDEAIGRVQPHF